MKHVKKLGAVLLALMMAAALAAPVAAADEPTRFVEPENSSNTYTLYKIFDATAAGTSLENFKWNSQHFNKGPFITAMQTSGAGEDDMDGKIRACFAGLNADSSDTDLAEALDAARQLNNDKAGALVAAALIKNGVWNTGAPLKIDTPLTGKPGYYMVVATPKDGGAPGYSLYNIYGNEGPISIRDKTASDGPEAGKRIKNKAGQWVYAADFAIGEPIDFQLTGTVKNYGGEGEYVVTFHDVMDVNQLTIPAETDITVYVTRNGAKIADITAKDLTVGKIDSCGKDGLPSECAFHISFNAGAIAGGLQNDDQIVAEYKSALKPSSGTETGAVFGTPGNVNDAWMESPNGNTPANPVTAYTFKLVASKVDGSNGNAPLPGAVFELTKDGAVIAALGTPVKRGEDGKPVKGEDGGYVYVDQDGEDVTDPVTEFTFPKLSAGKYVLTETQRPLTPEGREYNPAGPFYFEIIPVYLDASDGLDKELTSLTVKVTDEKGNEISENKPVNLTPSANLGTLTTQVVNNTGLQMPETGGIGTTIFYILGGVLVVGAVVLLITRRRMRADEE